MSTSPPRSRSERAAAVLGALLLLAAAPGAAGAADPSPGPAAATTAALEPAAVATPAPGGGTSPVAMPPPHSWKGWAVEGGWGYYEVLHAGVAWHHGRGAVSLFGGGGLAWDAKTIEAGLGYRHDVGPSLWEVQLGWDVKALYWTQSDANYDWKAFSVVAGAFAAYDLDRRLSLKLDGGVALSGALESHRKQDVHFGSPQRWNGSVCLELVYRLGR